MRKKFLLFFTIASLGIYKVSPSYAMYQEEDERGLSQSIPLPEASSVSSRDIHWSIKDFLDYLTKHKGKSFANIAKTINAHVQIDERVPHPLSKKKQTQQSKKQNISGYNDPYYIKISAAKLESLGFEINKHSWPTTEVIKNFAEDDIHCVTCGPGIAKRSFLWEKLKRAYEGEFNEFKQAEIQLLPN